MKLISNSMHIPFTIDEFLGVFEAYNQAIQPVQIIAYLLGILATTLAIKRVNYSGTIISGILAAFWVWTGVVYHVVYFSAINKAAYLFGSLFIVQGALFVYAGVIKQGLSFNLTSSLSSTTGAAFIMYAMIIYPVLNYHFGHRYPKMPVFGITPCPATIFTFGLLLCSANRVPVYLIVIPFLWSLIGVSAAINLGVMEDYGLAVAGIIGSILLFVGNRGKAAPA